MTESIAAKIKRIGDSRINYLSKARNVLGVIYQSTHDTDCDDWPESFAATSALYRERYYGAM